MKEGYSFRALKSIYGLKQAARDWNTTCHSFLKNLGFSQSLANPCLCTHQKGIILLMYVDDMAVAARNNLDLVWFYDHLSKRFNTKDLGEISRILIIRVTRNRKTRELFLNQEKHQEKILDQMGLPLTSSSTPKPKFIPVSRKYDKLEESHDGEARTNKTDYQQRVGSIMFAAVCSKSDISFHIGRLSQQLQDHIERHASGIKELRRYLRTTINQRIIFGPSESSIAIEPRDDPK